MKEKRGYSNLIEKHIDSQVKLEVNLTFKLAEMINLRKHIKRLFRGINKFFHL